MMKGIYLLLGSNLGDRLATLKRAFDLIDTTIGNVIHSSSIYTTKAWGVEDQPDFLNQVVEVESGLAPEEILINVNSIEEKLGRVRKIKWQSRIIDIDILYYGNLILNTQDLIIPHAENQNRNFVLVPMVELAPDFVHPVFLRTQQQLLNTCKDGLEVKKLSGSIDGEYE